MKLPLAVIALFAFVFAIGYAPLEEESRRVGTADRCTNSIVLAERPLTMIRPYGCKQLRVRCWYMSPDNIVFESFVEQGAESLSC